MWLRSALRAASRELRGEISAHAAAFSSLNSLYPKSVSNPIPWDSLAKKNLSGAVSPIVQPKRLCHGFMGQLTGMHIETLGQPRVLRERGTPTMISQRLDVRQG